MGVRYEAIVIGGGPAGATAAALLAAAGWSVALVEAKAFPRPKVCGECLAASNMPLLDALGIGEAYRDLAGPELRSVAVWRGNDAVSAPLPAVRASAHPWGRALGRATLDALLLERARAAGAVVRQPCIARAVRGHPGDLTCEVRDCGSRETLTLHAPLVIRAHGSWQPPPVESSKSIEAARRRDDHRRNDLLAFKATFADVRLAEGLLPVISFTGGYGGMVVAERGRATLACCIRRDRLAACRRTAEGEQAGDVIERLLREECRGVRAALREAVRIGPWLAAGPIRPGVRLEHATARTFLVGNAAGEVHPIIGEGISMALQSAWLLCEELTRCRDVLRPDTTAEARQGLIQKRYAALWRGQFSRRMRLAACFAHAAMRPRTSAPLLPLLRLAPQLLTLGARLSGKTRVIEVAP